MRGPYLPKRVEELEEKDGENRQTRKRGRRQRSQMREPIVIHLPFAQCSNRKDSQNPKKQFVPKNLNYPLIQAIKFPSKKIQ